MNQYNWGGGAGELLLKKILKTTQEDIFKWKNNIATAAFEKN